MNRNQYFIAISIVSCVLLIPFLVFLIYSVKEKDYFILKISLLTTFIVILINILSFFYFTT